MLFTVLTALYCEFLDFGHNRLYFVLFSQTSKIFTDYRGSRIMKNQVGIVVLCAAWICQRSQGRTGFPVADHRPLGLHTSHGIGDQNFPGKSADSSRGRGKSQIRSPFVVF